MTDEPIPYWRDFRPRKTERGDDIACDSCESEGVDVAFFPASHHEVERHLCEYCSTTPIGRIMLKQSRTPEEGWHKEQLEVFAQGLHVLERRLLKQLSAPVARKLIGWRTDDYLMETKDPEIARNWQCNFRLLPIFEGDPITKLVP